MSDTVGVTNTGTQFDSSKIYDHVFVGGGLGAKFAAYATLKAAKEAGKDISIVLMYDKDNAPCPAGSHFVGELEGMDDENIPLENKKQISALINGSITALVSTVAEEKIDCRLDMGYEWKWIEKTELDEAIAEAVEAQIITEADAVPNDNTQIFTLPGYDYSYAVGNMGQLNVPELLAGIVTRIEDMGGTVLKGVSYEDVATAQDGSITIKTTNADVHTHNKPLLATGPGHLETLPGYHFDTYHEWTGQLGYALSKEDAAKISQGPMAVADINFNDDVLWGGLDPKGNLTLGLGAEEDESGHDKIKAKIAAKVDELYPDLKLNERYNPVYTYKPMLMTENLMPSVGRLEKVDISGGWCGTGIVAGFAAAQAFADWYVHGDDTKLKVMESMQPKGFPGAPGYTPAGP